MKRFFCFLFLYFLAIPLPALFAQTATAGGSSQVRLNHIAVYVHDLARSTSFYENILRLKKIPEPFKDGKHTWFSLDPGSQLHLIQGAEKQAKHDKNDHICFSVSSIEEVIATLDKNKIEYTNWPGTAKAPTVRVDGVKQIYFQDPDGHWIEVNNDGFPQK